MRRVIPLVGLLVLSTVAAAPVPSVSNPGQVELDIDTRYSTTDSASTSVSITIHNTGNQTLQVNGLGAGSSNGISATCQFSCGASSISPGGSRSVTLSVTANEQASEGLHTVSYPVTFSNAASATASIPVRINKLEPGRLSYSIDLQQPSLGCPAPSHVSVSGTLTIRNVGDTSVTSATTSLSGPSSIQLQDTPPSSLQAGDSRAVGFSMTMPASSIPPLLTFTATGQYYARETRSVTDSGSLALAPPIQFRIEAPSGTGTDVRITPAVLGVLEPYLVPLSLAETCGYQAISIAPPPATDPSIAMTPGGPWQVQAGQNTAVSLTVTIPLSKVDLLCKGYANSLAFVATAPGATQTSTLTLEAPVDMAGTRQAIQSLMNAGSINGLDEALKQAAAQLGAKFGVSIGSGDCDQAGSAIRDVLAAAPPISWAFNLTRVVQSSGPGENHESFLAMGAMALRLPNLCNGLSSPDLASSCDAFASAYRSNSDRELQGEIETAKASHRSVGEGEKRVELEIFLAAANGHVGRQSEADQWKANAAASESRLNDMRAEAIERYAQQQANDQSWLRNPREAVAGDFRTLDPASFVVLELRYRGAAQEYERAHILAAEAGDTALASSIESSAGALRQAHDDALLTNFIMLGAWGVVLLGAISMATARAFRWLGQSRQARLGDVIQA